MAFAASALASAAAASAAATGACSTAASVRGDASPCSRGSSNGSGIHPCSSNSSISSSSSSSSIDSRARRVRCSGIRRSSSHMLIQRWPLQQQKQSGAARRRVAVQAAESEGSGPTVSETTATEAKSTAEMEAVLKREEEFKAAQQALAEKLAAAEAEAEALRQELAARRAEVLNDTASGSSGKIKVKIDGIGYRETIFSGPKTAGKLAKEEGNGSATESALSGKSWGFSEAELLAADIDDGEEKRPKEETEKVVQRRLLIGLAMAGGAAALSSFELPVTTSQPTKPLFVYVVPLLRLERSLQTVEEQGEFLDALGLRAQAKLAIGSMNSVRDNLLSTATLLENWKQAEAKDLAFSILDYLAQADYSNYFEGMGVPGPYQQGEYIKFSLQSLAVAKSKLHRFLSLVPEDVYEAAASQLDALSAAST